MLSHNEGHWCTTTNLLFWLRFIYCAIVSPSILHCFSFALTDKQKCKNHWKGVNDCNGLCLLHHANGPMHMYMITSSIIIIINAMLCHIPIQVSQDDLTLTLLYVFYGYDLSIHLMLISLSSAYNDKLVNVTVWAKTRHIRTQTEFHFITPAYS